MWTTLRVAHISTAQLQTKSSQAVYLKKCDRSDTAQRRQIYPDSRSHPQESAFEADSVAQRSGTLLQPHTLVAGRARPRSSSPKSTSAPPSHPKDAVLAAHGAGAWKTRRAHRTVAAEPGICCRPPTFHVPADRINRNLCARNGPMCYGAPEEIRTPDPQFRSLYQVFDFTYVGAKYQI
jgi:hypothetical protein